MSRKVSLVMPCYNKVEYIGNMLKSVYGQKWDNVEVILVNDGSTDGTREVIAEWQPKLQSRGYEVIVIDQINQGVCAAAKSGLARATGEFVCQIDSDDELDAEYVSTMADFLSKNPGYEWTACNVAMFSGKGEEKTFSSYPRYQYNPDSPNLLENYLLHLTVMTVWIYMVRSTYLKTCGVIENYTTESRGSHEPGYVIPLAAGGGKLKYFDRPLYFFNSVDSGMSHCPTFGKYLKYYEDYFYLKKQAIRRISLDEDKKRRLLSISEVAHSIMLLSALRTFSDGMEYAEKITREAAGVINRAFSPSPGIKENELISEKGEYLFAAIQDNILNETGLPRLPNGRIIGYGALGKIAGRLVPLLLRSRLKLTELWDNAARDDSSICGVRVAKPSFESLTEDDVFVVFPVNPAVVDETRAALKNTAVKNALYISSDYFIIKKFIAEKLFPGFYDGTARFTH